MAQAARIGKGEQAAWVVQVVLGALEALPRRCSWICLARNVTATDNSPALGRHLRQVSGNPPRDSLPARSGSLHRTGFFLRCGTTRVTADDSYGLKRSGSTGETLAQNGF